MLITFSSVILILKYLHIFSFISPLSKIMWGIYGYFYVIDEITTHFTEILPKLSQENTANYSYVLFREMCITLPKSELSLSWF